MYRFVVILVLIASISGQLSARKDYFEEDKEVEHFTREQYDERIQFVHKQFENDENENPHKTFTTEKERARSTTNQPTQKLNSKHIGTCTSNSCQKYQQKTPQKETNVKKSNLTDGLPTIRVGCKSFFFGLTFRTNWYVANRICNAHCLQLAKVSSKEEETALLQFIHSNGDKTGRFWVGGTDLGVKPGDYYWLSQGEKMRYTNWEKGQPDNGGKANDEHCVEINHHEQWNDSVCDKIMNYFICEQSACIPSYCRN